jgi:hypothetical protein
LLKRKRYIDWLTNNDSLQKDWNGGDDSMVLAEDDDDAGAQSPAVIERVD